VASVWKSSKGNTIGPRKSSGNLIVMKLIRSRFFQTNESTLHFVQPQSHLETGAPEFGNSSETCRLPENLYAERGWSGMNTGPSSKAEKEAIPRRIRWLFVLIFPVTP
jgi:hypothetical protein